MSFGIDRSKNKIAEDVDSEGTWAISYGDMVTLLLAFFVLFFTVNPDAERQDELQQSLILDLKKSSIVEREISSVNTQLLEGAKASEISVGVSELNSLKNIDETIVSQWRGKVYKMGQKIIIDFPNTSFFELGKVELNKKGRETLEEFVKVYMPYAGNYTLGIRAFTDTRKVRSVHRYKDNLELSALRSISAMRVLRDVGIPMNRIRLGGYGELSMTYDELRRLEKETGAKDLLSFARKIVLVIEPSEKSEEEPS